MRSVDTYDLFNDENWDFDISSNYCRQEGSAPGRTHHARLSTIIAKGCVNKALDVMYIVAFCIKDESHYVSESHLYSHALPSTYARTLSHTRSHINFALFFANGVGRRECAIFGSSYSTQLCVLQRR